MKPSCRTLGVSRGHVNQLFYSQLQQRPVCFDNPAHRVLSLVILTLLTQLAVLPTAKTQCVIRLEVEAGSNRMVLTSNNTLIRSTDSMPLSSPSTFQANVSRGFSGVLYAVSSSIPSCPTPTNRTGWLSSWPSFTLTTNSPSNPYDPPITIYPILHLGRTPLAFGSPDYNVSDLRTRLSAVAVTAIPDQSGNFTANWNAQLTSGGLRSDNAVTLSRSDDLTGVFANATGAPMQVDVQAVGGVNTLVVRAPMLQLTYQVIGNISIRNVTWYSYANFTFAGNLTARAVLGCPYCGDFGRCTNTSAGTTACVCDCGWSASNGQCSLPGGYCSAEGGQAAADSSSSPSDSRSPAPADPASVCNATNLSKNSVSSVNGACPDGYDWDEYGVMCKSCPSGFSGSGCVLCGSDTACKESLGSSTAQCSLSPLYRPRSQLKHYTCKLLDRTVAAILGTTLDFTCSTVKPENGTIDPSRLAVSAGLVTSNSPIGSTAFCAMSFRLSGMPRDAAVECTGWSCKFAVNSSKVNCPVIKCACPKGCSNAEGTITEATFTNLQSNVAISCGSEAGFDSTDADGTVRCTLDLGGLPITTIPVSCRTTECIDPVNGTVSVTEVIADEATTVALSPIIAWIPIMALLLLAAIALAAAAAFVRAAGPPASTSSTAPTDATAGAASPGGKATGESRLRGSEGDEPNGFDPAAAAAAAGPAGITPGQQQQPRQLGTAAVAVVGAAPGPRAGSAGSSSRGSSGGAPPSGSGAGRGPSGGCSSSGAGGSAAVPAVAAESVGNQAAYVWAAPGEAKADALALGEGRAVVQELSWHNLHLSSQPRRSALRPWRVTPSVTLLEDVSGRARSGEILGVLGPSGSGKTTLLSVLAGLIQPGLHWSLGGTVALDGRRVAAPRHLATLVGHVPQHDLLGRCLTVAESVAANAALRMSWGELRRGRQYVQARADAVLRELSISHLAHRIVWPGGGTPLTPSACTLSGGERLRVSAALELVSDPPLLLLDEPLSGLDSSTARATMAVLRTVAGGGGGRVLVMSLHQPSPALFAGLDAMMLMSGGRVAVGGAPGAVGAVLEAVGAPLPPPDVAIADHLLDLVMTDPKITAKLSAWYSANVAGAIGAGAGGAATDGGGEGRDGGDAEYVRALVRQRGGGGGLAARAGRLWVELGVLSWRSGLDILRNPSMMALHFLVTAIIGLLVGAVYNHTKLDLSGAQNRVGAIFFSVMLLACFATSAVDAIYPERPTVDRDLLRRSFGVLPYVAAKLALDGLLLRAIPAWAFGFPFYWLMGLRSSASAFFTFLGAFTTISCLAGAACITLSFLIASPGRAVLLLNLLVLISALFAGFLANSDSVPVWLRWINYLSPVKYCWEALVINELKPLVLNFSSPDLPQGLPAFKGTLFLTLLGVDAGYLNVDLIVLGCIYAILVITALSSGLLRGVMLRGAWK